VNQLWVTQKRSAVFDFNRYRDQEADDTEQVSKGEQGEEQPHRVQADFAADENGREYVISDKLADKEDGNHDQYWCPGHAKL